MPATIANTSSSRELLRDRNMHIIFAVTLAATMGVSLITPVLPQLVHVFGISKEEVILLITAFTLPGVLAAPFHGILADRFGRKKVLVPSLILFGLAGAACGLAKDFNILLILRFLQGIGGGGLFTLNNTIIGDLYPDKTRLQAMGMNASVISLGTALYPAVGGLIAGIHWRLPFFLPSFGVLVGLLVWFKLKNPEPESRSSIGGYLTDALKDMFHWVIIRLYILSFVAFILTFGPIIAFIPMWMDNQYGSTATVIGLVISSSSLSAAIVSSRLEVIGRRFTVGKILITAFLMYTVSLWIIPSIPSPWMMVIPALIFGAAQGLNLPSIQTLVAAAAPFEFRGVYMAVNSMVILSGITIGPVLAAMAFKGIGLAGLYYIGGCASLVMAVILIVRGYQLDTDNTSAESLDGGV